VILEPGKPLDSLYVILDGSVEISQRGSSLVIAKQNEVLGAWALFDPDPMPVTAKTCENVRLLRISRDDFYDLLSDNMEITAAIFSMLVRRFRQLVRE
jgi:CRP-like cAMP-binding protein